MMRARTIPHVQMLVGELLIVRNVDLLPKVLAAVVNVAA